MLLKFNFLIIIANNRWCALDMYWSHHIIANNRWCALDMYWSHHIIANNRWCALDMYWSHHITAVFFTPQIMNDSNGHYFVLVHAYSGDHGSTVVKVLRYKSEGRCIDPRWFHGNLSLTYLTDRAMALGSTQPLTEMSTRSICLG
jgi:hypothetical protein